MKQHNLKSVSGQQTCGEDNIMLSKCAHCGKPTDFFCPLCKKVFYCCEKHQRADWPNHKKKCAPKYMVKEIAPFGRCVVATRAYKAGETIMTEDPFVFGPVVSGSADCCIGCSGPLDFETQSLCPGCGFSTCHQGCPALTKAHAIECGYLKELKRLVPPNIPIRSLVLPARCYLLYRTNHSKLHWMEDSLSEAEARLAGEIEPKQVFPQFRSLVTGVHTNSAKLSFTDTTDLFVKVAALVHAYVLDFTSTMFGRKLGGLYESASYLHQSCTPNTRLAFQDGEDMAYRKKGPKATLTLKKDREEDELRRRREVEEREELLKRLKRRKRKKGKKGPKVGLPPREVQIPAYVPNRGRVTVTAIRDIKEGEILTCARTNHLMCTARRQRLFENLYRMRCHCLRCIDPRELKSDLGTAKCAECGGDVLAVDIPDKRIEFSRWKCVKCGETADADDVIERLHHVVNIYHLLTADKKMGRIRVEPMERLMTSVESTFHSNHEVCIGLKSILMRAYGNNPTTNGIAAADDQALKKRFELGRKMLSLIESLGPSVFRSEEIIVQYLIEHSKTHLERFNRFYEGGSWRQDRALQTVIEGFRLLKRASEILDLPNVPMDDLDYNIYSSLIYFLGQGFLNKAAKHGFKLPKGTLNY